jgi:phage gpG-like protein
VIRGRLVNAEAILASLRAQLARIQDFTTPLQQAGVVVRDAAIMRFKEQGGDQDWKPNTRGGHTGIDTGRLWQSIQVSPPAGNSVTVGTNVSYARWFQEGTGIFAGHSSWTVKPQNGKGLKFTIGGETFVRREVTIPGQPPRPFLVLTDQERADIRDVFSRWITQGTTS